MHHTYDCVPFYFLFIFVTLHLPDLSSLDVLDTQRVSYNFSNFLYEDNCLFALLPFPCDFEGPFGTHSIQNADERHFKLHLNLKKS